LDTSSHCSNSIGSDQNFFCVRHWLLFRSAGTHIGPLILRAPHFSTPLGGIIPTAPPHRHHGTRFRPPPGVLALSRTSVVVEPHSPLPATIFDVKKKTAPVFLEIHNDLSLLSPSASCSHSASALHGRVRFFFPKTLFLAAYANPSLALYRTLAVRTQRFYRRRVFVLSVILLKERGRKNSPLDKRFTWARRPARPLVRRGVRLNVRGYQPNTRRSTRVLPMAAGKRGGSRKTRVREQRLRSMSRNSPDRRVRPPE